MESEERRIAGVSPGGIRDGYTVKVLVCYLFDKLDRALTQEELLDIFSADETVDYFLLSHIVSELTKIGHLYEDGEKLVLTDLGRETSQTLQKDLPLALRERILETAQRILEKRIHDEEVSVWRTPDGTGYQVHARFHDKDLTFMTVSLFAPDETQASLLERRLSERCTALYSAALGFLLE